MDIILHNTRRNEHPGDETDASATTNSMTASSRAFCEFVAVGAEITEFR